MGKVVTYMNGLDTAFCQIELESKERIFISLGRDEQKIESPCGVKIFEMDPIGVSPVMEIWGSTDLWKLELLFAVKEDGTPCEKFFLDCVRDRLINCKTIKEVRQKLGISEGDK